MVKIIVLACAAGLLAGCSNKPGAEAAAAIPAVANVPTPPPARVSIKCDPLDASIAAEAAAKTPLASIAAGGAPALSAALMASEARKNDRLHQVLAAYEHCKERIRSLR